MARNLTREVVEANLARVDGSRTDEVLALTFDYKPHAHQYMTLTVSAVRRLCSFQAPAAIILPHLCTASMDSIQAGIRRSLKDLGIADLFTVFRRGNRVFIAPRSVVQ